jgi:hypothetical protein
MAISSRGFIEAQRKSVDGSPPVGAWRVYPDYEPWEHEEVWEHEGKFHSERFTYLQVPPARPGERPGSEGTPTRVTPDRSGVEVYAPLAWPNLFLKFAALFDHGPTLDAAPPVVLDWANSYGVLGIHANYPTPDGGWVSGRFDDRESVVNFARLSVEAGRCLRLFDAVRAPGGPDVDRLRKMGIREKTPKQLANRAMESVWQIVGEHLENETFTGLYRRRGDGTLFRGPAFHSLLGAMYLQMSNLITAHEEDIRRCMWCGNTIAFEEGEPPPSDAPKGARGKHKTHSNRKFCKRKYGRKDYCKNKYNYTHRQKPPLVLIPA